MTIDGTLGRRFLGAAVALGLIAVWPTMAADVPWEAAGRPAGAVAETFEFIPAIDNPASQHRFRMDGGIDESNGAAAIPEPITLVMTGAGFVVFAAARGLERTRLRRFQRRG